MNTRTIVRIMISLYRDCSELVACIDKSYAFNNYETSAGEEEMQV